jgi:hypothetical protein
MKRFFKIALLAAGSDSLPCLLPPRRIAQQSKPWEKIPIPKLHDFKPQQPKRIELKNGIVIFLQEDHELPFVSGSVLIPGGSRDEDPAKAGLVGSLRPGVAHQRHRQDGRRRHGRSARGQGRAH